MTIAVVLHAPDAVGGTERTAHLATAELRRRGHRVCLIQDRVSQAAGGYDEALTVPAFFKYGVEGNRCRGEVLNFLRRDRTSVVHVHAYPASGQLLWLARTVLTIATVHVPLCPTGARYLWKPRCVCNRQVGVTCLTGGYLRDDCGRLGNGVRLTLPQFAKAYYRHSRLRGALEHCTGLIVPGEWMKHRLISDGMDDSTIHVVRPPIQLQHEFQSESSTPPAILFAGRLVEVKGVSDLLRASAEIDVPHEIWLAGDGPGRRALEEECSRLKIYDRVKFFGAVSPEVLSELRARATLAAVPSRWPETFCMVGAEALGSGLPVVGYDAGAVREWLVDEKNGRLIELGNIGGFIAALRELLVDKRSVERLAAAARGSVEHLTLANHVDRLEAVYQNVAESTCKPQ